MKSSRMFIKVARPTIVLNFVVFVILMSVTDVRLFSQCYTPTDSLLVMNLLTKAKVQSKTINMPLFFAQHLKGTPYVGETLEINKKENLVVNLREVDCTTFVEYVLALSLSVREDSVSFEQFCHYLKCVRYQDGVIDGYASRNHYFSTWIESNAKQGFVREVPATWSDEDKFLTRVQSLKVDFMSKHPERYPMLKNNEEELNEIKACEKTLTGRKVVYVPKSKLQMLNEKKGYIENGDILAFVTRIDGLDISHVGFAVWKNGRLHLLNASSKHQKVVLEPKPLSEYLNQYPTILGIRIIRIL